jgi:hypothetical protein
LKKWLTEEDFKKRNQRWKNGNNKMKGSVDREEDTKGMPMKEQVAISRLRTGYTRAIHGPKVEGVGNPLCPFCNNDLSVDHILWECKETEDQRTSMDVNGTGKKTTIARRKRINQDSDGNEERRRSPWNINLRKKNV